MHMFGSKSRELMENIEGYLAFITTASLHFEEAMKEYLQGRIEQFEERRKEVAVLERKGDDELKAVKYKLYAFMLIPDTRGDVYKLMNDLDAVLNYAKKMLLELSIEKPVFPEFIKDDFFRMSESSVKSVGSLVRGVRAFFSHTKQVEDHVNKVSFYEKEVDKLEEQIKRKAFDSGEIRELSRKVQIRYFAERIALLSDISEEIARNLLIYTVKRMV